MEWTTNNTLNAELRSGVDLVYMRKVIKGFPETDGPEYIEAETSFILSDYDSTKNSK